MEKGAYNHAEMIRLTFSSSEFICRGNLFDAFQNQFVIPRAPATTQRLLKRVSDDNSIKH